MARPRRTPAASFRDALFAQLARVAVVLAIWSTATGHAAAAERDAGVEAAEAGAASGAAAERDAGVEAAEAGAATAEAGAPLEAPADAASEAAAEAAARAVAASLTAEQARAEHVRTEQEKLRAALAQRAKDASARAERAAAIGRDAETAESSAAAALFGRVIAELAVARQGFEEAMQEAAAPQTAPAFTPSASALAGLQEDPRSRALVVLGEALRTEAEALDRSAREGAMQRVESSLRAAAQLETARLLLLQRLDVEQRDAALGVSRAGVEQLGWEIWRVSMQLRGAYARRAALQAEALELLRDPFFWATLVKRLFAVTLVIGGAIVLYRRRSFVAKATAMLLALAGERPRLTRWIDGAGAALAALWPALLQLAALRALLAALGREAESSAIVQHVHGWLTVVLAIRLALAAAKHWIARGVDAPAGNARVADHKIVRSILRLGRYAIFSTLALSAVEVTLGAGLIYHHVDRVIALGWAWTAVQLLRLWQGDVLDAYLRSRPKGVLAGLIRRTIDRWSGVLVMPVVPLALLGFAAVNAIYRYSLRFEQMHRLLALIFRKRLERLARDADNSRATGLGLPDDLCRHFSGDALERPSDGIDVWPGLESFERLLADWRADRAVGTALLVGGFGSGKTSCLNAMKLRFGDSRWRYIPLSRRMTSGVELLATLAAELRAPPAAASSVRAFAVWLTEQPREMFVIDDLEHLFLRGVDAWSAWNTFLELVERSGHHTFWLCAMAQQPYRYLCFARRESADLFRLTIQLRPWTEAQITALIRARMEAAGYEPSFTKVVVGAEEMSSEERIRQAEHEFMRLVWDYSAGCPRVAMHFWLRSLRRDPDNPRRVVVNLFPAPREDDLEALNETERFVLAGVVWHDSLTTSEAVESFRYPELPCEAALGKLREMGLLDQIGGRHRVTTHWHRAIMAYLTRKHLIDP